VFACFVRVFFFVCVSALGCCLFIAVTVFNAYLFPSTHRIQLHHLMLKPQAFVKALVDGLSPRQLEDYKLAFQVSLCVSFS